MLRARIVGPALTAGLGVGLGRLAWGLVWGRLAWGGLKLTLLGAAVEGSIKIHVRPLW